MAAWDAATDERKHEVPDLSQLAQLQTLDSERVLLEEPGLAVHALSSTSGADLAMMHCLKIVAGGQSLDLRRFGPSNDQDEISALDDDAALDDYAYGVAGSVGEFWTEMSRHHMFPMRQSLHDEAWMKDGVRFGRPCR